MSACRWLSTNSPSRISLRIPFSASANSAGRPNSCALARRASISPRNDLPLAKRWAINSSHKSNVIAIAGSGEFFGINFRNRLNLAALPPTCFVSLGLTNFIANV